MSNVQPSATNVDNGGSVSWTDEGIRSMLKKVNKKHLVTVIPFKMNDHNKNRFVCFVSAINNGLSH